MVSGSFALGGLAARLGTRARLGLGISAVLAVFIGITVWSATRPVEIPSYYIIKWTGAGKCSVITERPEKGSYRLLWYSASRDSIDRKVNEFNASKKCR